MGRILRMGLGLLAGFVGASLVSKWWQSGYPEAFDSCCSPARSSGLTAPTSHTTVQVEDLRTSAPVYHPAIRLEGSHTAARVPVTAG
jgi:hypothetical protein